jgi:hypothetical protein
MLERSPNIRARYLLMWPGAGSAGNMLGVGMIMAQSFGRNTYSDDKLGEVLDSFRRKAKYQSEDTFKILESSGFDPGDMNRSLAEELILAMEKYSIRIAVLQWEIGYAVWVKRPDFFQKKEKYFEIVWPEIGQKYMSSLAVIKQAANLTKRWGGKKVACLSHRRMETRVALMAAERMDTDLVCLNSSTTSFSKKSVQWWTRGPIRWLARETVVRITLLFTGLV